MRALARGVDGGWRRHAARRPRGAAQRRSVGPAGRLPQGQRRGPLHPWRRAERLLGHRHGLSAAGGTRPIRSRRAPWMRGDRPVRLASTPRDGGDSYRYSGSVDWQRTANNASTKVSAFGIGYDLNLFSNFTYFLDDPENGDQFRQADRRFVSGAKVSHRRHRAVGRPRGPEHGRRSRSATTTSRTSACITPCDVSRSTPCVRTPCCRPASARLRAERDRVDAVAADAGRRARGRLPLRRRGRRAGQLGHRLRRAGQPEGRRRRSARSTAPSSTPTPASASTATTPAARPSPSIRPPATPPIA